MRMSKEKVEKWIFEGRGQGHGKDYLPWLKIARRENPSGGHLEFEHAPLLGRHPHLFSKNELLVALLLMWLGLVDLREQFPCWPWPHPHPLYQHPSFNPTSIPWSVGSIQCAHNIGVAHPCFPGTRIPYVPTIDLMATRIHDGNASLAAFAVKPSEDEVPLTNKDLEKLAITTEFCRLLSIPWRLVSGSLIPATLACNLQILHPYSGLLDVESEKQWSRFIYTLNCNLSTRASIEEALYSVSEDISLPHATVLTFFRRALWFRETKVDLRHAIVMSAPPIMSDLKWVQETINYMYGEDNG